MNFRSLQSWIPSSKCDRMNKQRKQQLEPKKKHADSHGNNMDYDQQLFFELMFQKIRVASTMEAFDGVMPPLGPVGFLPCRSKKKLVKNVHCCEVSHLPKSINRSAP